MKTANTMRKTTPTLFALFGNPIKHSLSPLMHNAVYKRMRINAHYVPVCVEDLGEAIRGIRKFGMRGVSITIPFKTAVIPYLDWVDDDAVAIGAVNTIVNDDNLGLRGYNTDWIGIVRSLEECFEIPKKTFAILGAGGAARAAVFGILQRGGIPVIVNRNLARGAKMAGSFGCSFHSLSEIATISADCLINTTPVGMAPEQGKSPLPREVLGNFKWVMDCIYNPLKTQLLRDAEETGCQVMDGVRMFVHQGAEQIKLWTRKEPPREFMKQVVLKKLRAKDGD
jgi:shikimate dehydrogenase